MGILAGGGSDIGRKRKLNEDSYGVFDDLGLYVVADGMGGHAAGEVASAMTVEILHDFIKSTADTDEVTWPFERDPDLPHAANRLLGGIRLANQAILKRSQESAEQRGMGTTVVAALSDADHLYIAHVGDSRAYVFSGGSLKRLTTDHSYVEEMVAAGHLTPDQARVHPLRNIVTRALGTKEDVKIDLSRQTLVPGDVYLLCSDGLTGMLKNGELEGVVNEYFDVPSRCVERLIQEANLKGGDDNITAIVLKVY